MPLESPELPLSRVLELWLALASQAYSAFNYFALVTVDEKIEFAAWMLLP